MSGNILTLAAGAPERLTPLAALAPSEVQADLQTVADFYAMFDPAKIGSARVEGDGIGLSGAMQRLADYCG